MRDASIDELIKALWSRDSEVCEKAIASIKARGKAALPALMAALKKGDHNAEFVDFENEYLRRAIIEIGEPAFEKLVKALRPGSDMVRAAAKTLRIWGDKRAVDYMIAAMLNKKIVINDRCYVIDALGSFRDAKAFEPLKTALMDENEYIRRHAARALVEFGDVSVMPSIFEALTDPIQSWYGTKESIGEIGKLLRQRCIEKGIEEEFITCLKQMESRYPGLVGEYKAWNRIT